MTLNYRYYLKNKQLNVIKHTIVPKYESIICMKNNELKIELSKLKVNQLQSSFEQSQYK